MFLFSSSVSIFKSKARETNSPQIIRRSFQIRFTSEIPLVSPPHSSNTTIRFWDLSHERGTWYLQKKEDREGTLYESRYVLNRWKNKEAFWLHSPSLRSFTTITQAFLCVECSSVVATSTVSLSFISRPVTSNVSTVYPNMTFPHCVHVYGQWFVSSWCGKS